MSFVGHVTLANYVIEVPHTYTMTSNMVPKKCLKKIQIMQRDFIWGHNSDTKKIHTIRWHGICKPKNFGGLGLRHFSGMNEACITKLGWKLKCGDKALWCQILKSKYKRKEIVGNVMEVKQYDSSMWKNILNIGLLLIIIRCGK